VRAASVRTVLDPATIQAGQGTTLALVFEGGVPDVLPALPAVPNLGFRFAGRSDQQTFANGRLSSTTVFRHIVTATQPGTYTIPAFSVKVDGQTLTTTAVQLTVVAGNPGDNPQATAGAAGQVTRAFLRIAVPRTNVFVGEVLPIELNLYAINPRQFELGTLTAEGFTLGKQERIEPARVPVNGVFYTRTGMRTVVTPTRIGPLKLGPVKGRVELLVPVARRRGDPFDDFFNDPFFNRSSELMVADVAAEALGIQVQPLPATNVPPGYTGAVGSFTMEVTAGPTNVAVGDPVRLRVQLSGNGQLESLTLPSLDAWSDFRVYPALSRVETTDALGVQGAKVIEHDLIPQNAEVRAVPELVFSFFDPVNQAYVTLKQPAIPLLVRPVGNRGPALASTDTAPPPREIVHLKPRPGALAWVGPPLLVRPWFVVLALAPVVSWLGVLTWRRRREHLARHPREVRRRAVARKVREGIEELRQLAGRGEGSEVFVRVFRLLQEQLGERLDLPAASITESVLDDRLQPAGVRPELVSELHSLLQACNQARYAPVGSVQDLQETVTRLERVLTELRRIEL
jgi:hypothetical protein